MPQARLLVLLTLTACSSEPARFIIVTPEPAAAPPPKPPHCLVPGAALELEPGRKQEGCPCDPQLQRDTCIDGLALICEQGAWRRVMDGPCGEHVLDSPAACSGPQRDAQACTCSGEFCFIREGRAHACSAGRWLDVSVGECWQRSKAL
jgi:hypothetical protein